jgi:hypothetical protein
MMMTACWILRKTVFILAEHSEDYRLKDLDLDNLVLIRSTNVAIELSLA